MKQIRLEPEAYRLGHGFSVTLTTAERVRIFIKPEAVQACLTALKHSAARYEAKVYAYCFMPDHLHLLASSADGVSFIDFIRHFKQLSSYRLSRRSHIGRPPWQSRFYDYALRSDEDVVSAARYIFDNPVRAGVVAKAGDYPYSGSFVWEGLPCSSGFKDPDLHRQTIGNVSRNVGG